MRRWLERIGLGIAVVVGLFIVAVTAVYAMSESRFRRTYTVASEALPDVSREGAVVARGAHLASTIGCFGCHGEGLKGGLVVDAFPLGRVTAYNLTRGEGGIGASLTRESIERAVRHGVGRDGRALRIMPADEYQAMTDADMQALTAYVTQARPVNNVLPPTNIMLLPRTLMLTGAMPLLPHDRVRGEAHVAALQPSPTAEYGRYLANLGGCRGCHGPELVGGKIAAGDPSWPPATNLTVLATAAKWTEADFIRALRTGKRPDGTALKAPMPWQTIGQMTDDELRAVWAYIQTVPARSIANH